MAKTKEALKIVDKMIGDDAELRAMIDEEAANREIAQMIYDARTRAGLSQKELAELVGTKQQVISQLEDADYQGHSLSMLKRIAAALGHHIELRLIPNIPEGQHA